MNRIILLAGNNMINTTEMKTPKKPNPKFGWNKASPVNTKLVRP